MTTCKRHCFYCGQDKGEPHRTGCPKDPNNYINTEKDIKRLRKLWGLS